LDTTTRFVTIHGHKRAYRMCGSGPALLLLHGIGDSSASWVPLMRPLAERYTVIAPDLLGHGESDKPRADYSVAAYANGMRDLLDVLDIDRATVVGHSLGGGVAAQLSYQYPERVERLVLVSAGGVGKEVSPILRAAAAPLSEIGMVPLMIPGANEALGVVLGVLGRFGLDIGRDAGEVARVLKGMPDRRQRAAFGRTLRAVVDWRGQLVTMLDRAYLAQSMPVLLVWGGHDGMIPVDHAFRAHEALPGSLLSIYPEAGHFPHHADPDRFVDELIAFIADTESYRSDRLGRRSLLLAGPGGVAADEPDEPALIG